jgi:hypothetical protein
MSINSYFFAVAFFIFFTLCIYICIRRVSSHFPAEKTRMINKLNLAVCSFMALGAVGLATYTFFYLQNQKLIVVSIKFFKISSGIQI